MKVTLLQTDVSWKSPRQNIANAESLMAGQPDADVYVLPEMWSTGFLMRPDGFVGSEDTDEALAWMRSVAVCRSCAVCGSLSVRVGDGSFRNRHYFIDGRSHAVHFYDKCHLFSHGGEDVCYTAGTEHTVVDYCGMRLLLLTCYDLRFPCWSRYTAALQYDTILIVANWPRARQQAWQVLAQARAIENQCYVVAVNRVGEGGGSHYVGGSCVVSPQGELLLQCDEKQQLATAEIFPEEVKKYREGFNVLANRDIL